MRDPLSLKIQTTQAVLSHRMDDAAHHPDTRDRPRDHYAAIDPFLASCSQHLAGLVAVLVPEARKRLDDGDTRAHEMSHQIRELEKSMNAVKARAYGSAYVNRRPWSEIWQELGDEFHRAMRLERALVVDLAATLGEHEREQLTERLLAAERHAPTRPHPFVPHRGVPGRAVRQVTRVVDAFWDQAEGRMIPEPVHHHDRAHEGLLAQYLLADPHLRRD